MTVTVTTDLESVIEQHERHQKFAQEAAEAHQAAADELARLAADGDVERAREAAGEVQRRAVVRAEAERIAASPPDELAPLLRSALDRAWARCRPTIFDFRPGTGEGMHAHSRLRSQANLLAEARARWSQDQTSAEPRELLRQAAALVAQVEAFEAEHYPSAADTAPETAIVAGFTRGGRGAVGRLHPAVIGRSV